MKPAKDILDSMIEKGSHELDRETDGLFLSSLSAGLDIGFGPLLMGVILTLSAGSYGDLQTELLLASAYSVGFIFVILGRSELFTEHTTLAVMPVIDGEASLKKIRKALGNSIRREYYRRPCIHSSRSAFDARSWCYQSRGLWNNRF